MERLCAVCTKRFKTYPSKVKDGRGKYCSKACCLSVTSVSTNVATQFVKGQKPHNFKGWRYCGRGRKYKQVYKPEHPQADRSGYVREHRLVMEQKIDRLLTKNEEVHHLDGNGLNNSPDNLVIMSKSSHLRLEHQLGTYSKNGRKHNILRSRRIST